MPIGCCDVSCANRDIPACPRKEANMTTGWIAPPEPPELPPGTAEKLARYAEQIALHIQREMEQTRQDGRDVSEFPWVIQGWEFTALALRETYDLESDEEGPQQMGFGDR